MRSVWPNEVKYMCRGRCTCRCCCCCYMFQSFVVRSTAISVSALFIFCCSLGAAAAAAARCMCSCCRCFVDRLLFHIFRRLRRFFSFIVMFVPRSSSCRLSWAAAHFQCAEFVSFTVASERQSCRVASQRAAKKKIQRAQHTPQWRRWKLCRYS